MVPRRSKNSFYLLFFYVLLAFLISLVVFVLKKLIFNEFRTTISPLIKMTKITFGINKRGLR